ncbi:MAG: hypothetical protein ACP5NQ_04550 [Vulcanisaeta sp.]
MYMYSKQLLTEYYYGESIVMLHLKKHAFERLKDALGIGTEEKNVGVEVSYEGDTYIAKLKIPAISISFTEPSVVRLLNTSIKVHEPKRITWQEFLKPPAVSFIEPLSIRATSLNGKLPEIPSLLTVFEKLHEAIVSFSKQSAVETIGINGSVLSVGFFKNKFNFYC